MRRIAAVAVAAGVLLTGMAVTGAMPTGVAGAAGWAAPVRPADAASRPAAPRWEAHDSYGNVRAWGTYVRSGGRVEVQGHLVDGKRNGWTACVRFLFTEGDRQYWSRQRIVGVDRHNREYDFDGPARVDVRAGSRLSGHLYVQECGREKKTGRFFYGKGKRLF